MCRILQAILLIIVLCGFSRAWAEDYSFVTLEFPPIEYTAPDGKVEGIAVEIVTHIMNRLGHTVHIKAYPWTRAMEMVLRGDADAIFTAYKTPERVIALNFCTETLLPQVIYLYKKSGVDIDFDGDLETLKGKRIGVVSTISYGVRFDQYKNMLHIEKANQLEQNFQKLLLGRLDLVVSNIYTGEYTIRKLGFGDKIEKLPKEIESVASYIAFSRKRNLTRLRDQFDEQMAEFRKTEEYARILSRYGVDTGPSSRPPAQ